MDLLSGPGLVRIKDSDDQILGSPLVSAIAARAPFSHMFFVDVNNEYIDALKERFQWLDAKLGIDGSSSCTFIAEDCNDAIDKILEEMQSPCHFLAFVDCEGMDVNWDSICRLLQFSGGDIIFTFHTRDIWRLHGKAMNELEDSPNSQRMTSFIGSDQWRHCTRVEELLDVYKSQFVRQGRDIVENITIAKGGKGGHHYDLIFATKQTKSGSPWMDGVHYLKERIEQHTGKAAQMALDILTGRQPELEYFFPD